MPNDIREKVTDAGKMHCLECKKIFFLLVGYVEEGLWWPIQSSNIGGKKKASS